MVDLTQLSQLGTLAVTPENPCGTASHEDPEYLSLQEEIAKIESLSKSGSVDWGQIVILGVNLLSTKSKDLWVASYLSRALFAQDGYAGAQVALTIYRDMLGQHWQGLFPQRPRARTNAVNWMAERLGRAIAQQAPTEAEYEAVRHCRELLQEIFTGVEAQGQKDTFHFKPLTDALRARLADLPEPSGRPLESPAPVPLPTPPVQESTQTPVAPVPAPPPPPVSAETPTPTATERPASTTSAPAAPAATTEVTTDTLATRALRGAQTSLRNVAAFFLAQNVSDPRAYRLARIATWLQVSQLPPHDKGRTQLPGPATGEINGYEQDLAARNFAHLIAQVEAGFLQAPYWLDAHRLTAAGLEALGHTEARRAVIEELAHFLRRFPGLLDLQFADGTPFANAQTRLWVANAVLAPATEATGRQDNGTARREAGPSEAAWGAVAQEAQQLAAQGNIRAGLALLYEGCRQAGAPQDRFHWQLQQAHFCVVAGLTEVAIPQLEFLEEQINRFVLDEWEPALSLEVFSLLWQCYKKQQGTTPEASSGLREKMERLHHRLCRLDVAAVLALEQKL